MSRRNESVEVEVEVVERVTTDALHCKIGKKLVWIPRSQIRDDESEIESTAVEGETGTLVIPRWLAEAKDLDV